MSPRSCRGCGTTLPADAHHRRKWCSEGCRKQTLYAGECVDCGAPTNGSDGRGRNAPERCVQCANAARAIWSRESVIAAIQRFAERYGRAPGVTDFLTGGSVSANQRERFYRDGDYPHERTVRQHFSSLADALVAAGFERPHVGRYRVADRSEAGRRAWATRRAAA